LRGDPTYDENDIQEITKSSAQQAYNVNEMEVEADTLPEKKGNRFTNFVSGFVF
jgi:hypothetical protein